MLLITQVSFHVKQDRCCYKFRSIVHSPSLPLALRSHRPGWQERFRRDCTTGLQALEVGQSRRWVPAVLNETQVRERVGEVRNGLELEDESLLSVGLTVREMEVSR